MGQEIGINADSGIAHFEPEATIRRRQHDGDMSARRSELDRVGEDIPHDLFQSAGVALHQERMVLGDRVSEDQAFVVGAQTHGVDSVANDVAQIDGADRQPHPPRYELTRIHQVVNQLPKRIRVAIDGRNRALDAVGPHRVLFEHARPPDYRGHRRAKFV